MNIPYLEQLYLKLDKCYIFLNKMPDFIGKLRKEGIFKNNLIKTYISKKFELNSFLVEDKRG